MSFTPGPWKAKPSCAGPNWGWFVEGPPEADYHDSQFEKEEDARLVAAAPDLLAALQWYVDNDETNEATEQAWDNKHWLDGKRRAEAAIAKATKGAGS